VEIAKATGLSSAQVVLLWNLQHGVPVVTKCTSEDHLLQVSTILRRKSLSSKQMKMVDAIKGHMRFVAPPFMYKKGTTYAWGDGHEKKDI
jgi:diketogulonate reductase-like aldo/keto reductase